ncbi:MAG: hypothetical protein HY847_19505 [Betaproteobacteria bacterium]|nr:hypothetical protein [Betaproteobacteria bacterium]
MNQTRKRLIADGHPHERWHPLDGGEIKITTFVPLRFRKRGVKKVVVGVAGVDDPVSFHTSRAIAPTHDSVLLRALGRGHYWQHLLDSGIVANARKIAEREGIDKATVCELLRLAHLAPEITQAALAGTLPRTMSLANLLRTAMPRNWGEQWEVIAGMG